MVRRHRLSKQEILSLQKTLKTDAAIGAKFGISRQAVHQKRVKFGIAPIPEKQGERNKLILALHKKGVKGNQIAKKAGIGLSQMYRILKRASKGKRK
jgi:hypothetical protein